MLKLKALEEDDVKIISSLVQDSILPIGDFTFLKPAKQAMFAINRYCHEDKATKNRCNSLLTVNNVTNMQIKNIDLTDRKQNLCFLDISVNFDTDEIIFLFSDNKMIKMDVSKIEITLTDVSEKWSVYDTPRH